MSGHGRETAAWLAALSDAELAAALADLGRSLAAPAPVDLPGSVVGRLSEGRDGAPRRSGTSPRRPRSSGWPGPSGWTRWLPGHLPHGASVRRAVVLAVIAALVLAGIAAALGFGLPGIRIIFGPGPSAVPSAVPSSGSGGSRAPGTSAGSAGAGASAGATAGAAAAGATPPTAEGSPQPLGAGLALGQPVSLADARAAAGFPVGVPSLSGLGPPDGVWIDPSSAPPVVSLAWRSRPAAAGTAGVGVLLSELPGRIETAYFGKFVNSGTTITPTAVGDGGWWITGAPHEVALIGPDGNVRFDTVRLARNVLLWTAGGVTFRLETSLDETGALEVARSVH